MPFLSKVGAMPPPTRNDDQQDSRARPNRQKAITMEDLKKQTALRLAHEHHQTPGAPGSSHSQPSIPPVQPVDSKGRPIVTPETLAARSHSTSSFSSREPPAQQTQHYPPHHFQRLHHQQSPSGHHHIHHGADSPGVAPAYSGMMGQPGRYYDSGSKLARKKGLRPPSSVSVPAPHAPVATQAGGSGYYTDQRSQYVRPASVPNLPANPPVAAAPGYDTASSNQGLQSSSSSKLPHGLTVHELKEMTKARLQAEAAENLPSGAPDRPSSTTASMTERDSQLDSRSTTPANYAHQMNSQDYHLVVGNSVDSMSSHPAEMSGRHPPQVSPPPAAFQPFHPPTSSFNDVRQQGSNIVMGNRSRVHSCPDTSWDSRVVGNRDRLDSFPEVIGNRNRIDSFPEMSGHRTRVDSFRDYSGNRGRLDSFPDSQLECASVTSHNSTVASDYLGSESAYSSGAGGFSQGNDDRSFLPVQRTQSFPAGNGHSSVGSEISSQEHHVPATVSPQGNYYESSAGLAQNRGRSLTMSPRPGLSLLHEDRPGFNEEDIGIPSFSSSRHARQQAGSRSRISPVFQPQGFPPDSFSGIASGSMGSYSDNRPRASSATSLPAMSHTAEEFGSESFYGSSSLYSNGSDATGGAPSSVFRERLATLPAPPGLSRPSDVDFHSGSDMNTLASRMGSIDSLGSNRARAATWNPGRDMFGSGSGSGSGLYECSGDDTLAGDLASILKLSEAEEKADNGRSGGMFRDAQDSFLGGLNEFKENDSRSQRF